MASVFRKPMTHHKLNLWDSTYRLNNNLCIFIECSIQYFHTWQPNAHSADSPSRSFIKCMRSHRPAPPTQPSVISHSRWAPTRCDCCFYFTLALLVFTLRWKRKCGNCVVYILNQLGHWAEFRCASVVAACVWKLQRARVLLQRSGVCGRRSWWGGSCNTVLNMWRKRRKFNSSFVVLLGVTRSQMKQNQLWLIEMNDGDWRPERQGQ